MFPVFTLLLLSRKKSNCCGLKKVVAKSRAQVYSEKQILALMLVFHQTHNLSRHKFARALANQPISALHFFNPQEMLNSNKLITPGEKRATSTKTCNETMLHDKLTSWRFFFFVSPVSPRLFPIAALTLTYRLKCCGTTFSTIQEQTLWLVVHSSRLSWPLVVPISCHGYPTSRYCPWYPLQDFRLASISKVLRAGTIPPGRDMKSVSSQSWATSKLKIVVKRKAFGFSSTRIEPSQFIFVSIPISGSYKTYSFVMLFSIFPVTWNLLRRFSAVLIEFRYGDCCTNRCSRCWSFRDKLTNLQIANLGPF